MNTDKLKSPLGLAIALATGLGASPSLADTHGLDIEVTRDCVRELLRARLPDPVETIDHDTAIGAYGYDGEGFKEFLIELANPEEEGGTVIALNHYFSNLGPLESLTQQEAELEAESRNEFYTSGSIRFDGLNIPLEIVDQTDGEVFYDVNVALADLANDLLGCPAPANE